MKNVGAFLLVIGAAAAIYYNKMKRDALRITAKIKSISIDSAATAAAYYLQIICILRLEVFNTTSAGGTIKSINADIFYNGQAITKITNTTDLLIAANSTNAVALKVAIPSLKIFSTATQVLDAFRNKKPIAVDIVGTIETNYGTIPINQTINII